jgi:hypothetical protein
MRISGNNLKVKSEVPTNNVENVYATYNRLPHNPEVDTCHKIWLTDCKTRDAYKKPRFEFTFLSNCFLYFYKTFASSGDAGPLAVPY